MESRSRRLSMGRPAPRPLLLALLSLGECAWGSAGRGVLGGGRARLQHGAWGTRGAWGGSPETQLQSAGPPAGWGTVCGRPEPGAHPPGPARGVPGAARPGGAGSSRVPGEWPMAGSPTALSTCWPPGTGLTLNSRPRKVRAAPARVHGWAEI